MPNVTVYVKARDWRLLEEAGVDPSLWTRRLVADGLERWRGGRKVVATGVPSVSGVRCEFRHPMVPAERCTLGEGHLGPHQWRGGV